MSAFLVLTMNRTKVSVRMYKYFCHVEIMKHAKIFCSHKNVNKNLHACFIRFQHVCGFKVVRSSN